ncbi:alcohol oxidase [Desarmillaria tabescens]|uniref:Alcohol oxidase n=1 Tax=Armillaria tabescens TaxID=1929756 RepID=A0AA39N7P6_ARMTA|nr:alcohol oxidase [Desarmillaria tabescens]KAK0460553.1 alcohol oxidase [Desarmillaria tabescens]
MNLFALRMLRLSLLAARLLPLLCLFLWTFVEGKSCQTKNTVIEPQEFGALTFDYLIVGAGTAGLTLASRLAEDQDVQVGVIEAGAYHENDPLVDVPANIGAAGGNADYDWRFSTVPQESVGGRVISPTQGKLLGGSSAINFLAWTRASKIEYDAWTFFSSGQNDWSWDGLFSYFIKSTSIYPNQTNTFLGIPSGLGKQPNYHDEGFNGPIQASHNVIFSDVEPLYAETMNSIGIPMNGDPDNGNDTGLMDDRASVDRAEGKRSYAASYYLRSVCQSNFHVLTNAEATKVLFQADRSGLQRATGVEFWSNSTSQMFVATVRREIILSAGAFQTPHLLELSGIGNATLLENLGISPLIDLPNVGENLQDHPALGVQYEMNEGIFTFDALLNNATLASEQNELYNQTGTGLLAATNAALTFVPFSEEETGDILTTFDTARYSLPDRTALQQKQYDFQRVWLAAGRVPQLEILLFHSAFIEHVEGRNCITVLAAGLHHISRGSVHSNTSSPLSAPVIDPSYLDNNFDVDVMLRGLKFALKIGSIPPLADNIANIVSPPTVLQTDEELIQYIRNSLGTSQHPMGTAAMAPRSLGGVVDGALKVYGTSNLRVCDASAIPIAIGTHLQATIYAMGEKVADIIKEVYN